LSFERRSERTLHTWRAFSLVHGDFVGPGGEAFSRTYLKHPGAVGIVALDGTDVILVRQYRAALGRELLEIPAGTLDREGEPPLECAKRELGEEAGATASTWEFLLTYAVAPGVSSEELHLFVATGLTFGERQADGLEEAAMTIERFPAAELSAAIADGRITDAKTILGISLVAGRTG
jgi:8-oxo-dGTP pyrophosphatase MutT (NUDIX family)